MSSAVRVLSKTLHCHCSVHFKISSWFSKAKLDHCNCTVRKWCEIAFCLGKPGKACQLPMDAICWHRLQKTGAFLVLIFCCLWKLSPTQSTEEQGADQIASWHFYLEKLRWMLCSAQYGYFQGRESPLWPQTPLPKASLFFTYAAGQCCLSSWHLSPPLAGWEPFSTNEQPKR